MKYEDDRRFRACYLEDSWVLGIAETRDSLTFTLEIALTPEHPEYAPALPDEQHCYRGGELAFTGVRDLRWLKTRNQQPAIDSAGGLDFGNIDVFTLAPSDIYRLAGEWGEVEFKAEHAELRLRPG